MSSPLRAGAQLGAPLHGRSTVPKGIPAYVLPHGLPAYTRGTKDAPTNAMSRPIHAHTDKVIY